MKNKKLIPEIRFPEFSGEWVEKRLGELTKIYDGTHQTPKYVKKGIPFFSVENITQNKFNNTKFISQEAYEKEFNGNRKIEKGDLLLTRIGDIGSIKYFDKPIIAGYYVSVALIKNSNSFNSKFLKFYIETPYFQKELYKRTLHIAFPKKINLNEIGKCSIKLPPTLDEQKKIANFLSSVDEKIEIVSKKIEELKKYKKGMLQKLLDVKCNNGKCEPELRFKGFSGDWIEKRLGEILKERKEYSTKNNNNIHLTLSKDGIFPKTEQFNRDFLVTNKNKKYKITYLNDICYNPANLKFGVIGRNKYGKGIFSPIYITFKIKNANPIFIENIVTSKNFINKALKYQEGTVYERMAVKPEDLLKLTIFIPPTLAEQQKIANFLSSIDEKIELNEKKLEKLKAYKKGLLQKMFV